MHKMYDCDCCGKATPMHQVQQCWTSTGLETWACPACRGEEVYCPRCAMPAVSTAGVEYPNCNCPDND